MSKTTTLYTQKNLLKTVSLYKYYNKRTFCYVLICYMCRNFYIIPIFKVIKLMIIVVRKIPL